MLNVFHSGDANFCRLNKFFFVFSFRAVHQRPRLMLWMLHRGSELRVPDVPRGGDRHPLPRHGARPGRAVRAVRVPGARLRRDGPVRGEAGPRGDVLLPDAPLPHRRLQRLPQRRVPARPRRGRPPRGAARRRRAGPPHRDEDARGRARPCAVPRRRERQGVHARRRPGHPVGPRAVGDPPLRRAARRRREIQVQDRGGQRGQRVLAVRTARGSRPPDQAVPGGRVPVRAQRRLGR
jgi:hypothetical protein